MRKLTFALTTTIVVLAAAACTGGVEDASPVRATQQTLESTLKPRHYRHWVAAPSKGGAKVQLRAFSGLVMLPDLSKALADTKSLSQDQYGNVYTGWRKDGASIRSVITDAKGVSTDVLVVAQDGSISSTLDIDGDRVADVVDVMAADGTRHVFATEGVGADFFAAWLRGWNPFCRDAAVGLKDQSFVAAFGCGGDDSSGGASAGPLGMGGTRGSLDPFDALCAGRVSKRPGFSAPVMAHGGHGYGSELRQWEFRHSPRSDGSLLVSHTVVYRDVEGNHVSTLRTVVEHGADGSTRTTRERIAHDGTGTRTVTERRSDGSTTTRSEDFEAKLNESGFVESTDPPGPSESASGGGGDPAPADPGPDPDTTTPSPGPSGTEPDPEAALTEWCERRAEDHRSGAETAAETDPRETEMDCDDPVTNPDPTATTSTSDDDPRDCGVPQAERSDVMGALGAGTAASTCGPYEQPGADGTCGPGRTIDQLRGGGAWIGQANIPGLELCNPMVCNPSF